MYLNNHLLCVYERRKLSTFPASTEALNKLLASTVCYRRNGRKLKLGSFPLNINSMESRLTFYSKSMRFFHKNLGPVVQSIVSLTSSLRGQLVKCFTTLQPNTLKFFVEKMREAFAVQKLLTFFQQKILANFRY